MVGVAAFFAPCQQVDPFGQLGLGQTGRDFAPWLENVRAGHGSSGLS